MGVKKVNRGHILTDWYMDPRCVPGPGLGGWNLPRHLTRGHNLENNCHKVAEGYPKLRFN